jgi:hypothetical protein
VIPDKRAVADDGGTEIVDGSAKSANDVVFWTVKVPKFGIPPPAMSKTSKLTVLFARSACWC